MGSTVEAWAVIIYQLVLNIFNILAINTAEPLRAAWLEALLTTP